MMKLIHKMPNGGGYKTTSCILLATTILFAALFGVLWVKGNYTERALGKLGIAEEQNQERSDYWACYSWQTCLEQMNVDADICFFGDSITRGTNFQSQFSNKKIVNLGLSGDSLDGMLQRIETVKTIKPETIFVEGGINGFKTLGVTKTVDRYKKLLTELKENLPDARMYICGIFPIVREKEKEYGLNKNIAETDRQIETLCDEMGITYIDIYSELVDDKNGYLTENYSKDGIHLNDRGQAVWLSVLEEYIK